MKSLFLCALLGSLALALPATAQTAPPPVEAFGRLPAIADAAISPDGRRVALATSQSDGQSAVLIVNLDQPSERTGFAAGDDMQLRGVTWADNERVAYLVSQTFQPGQILPVGMRFPGRPRRVDYYRWATINRTTGRAEILTTNRDDPWADQGASLISPIEGDPGYARMIGRSLNLDRSNAVLFRVDLDSGRVRPQSVHGINEDTVDFIVARDGAVAGRLDTNRETNRGGSSRMTEKRHGCLLKMSPGLANRFRLPVFGRTAVLSPWKPVIPGFYRSMRSTGPTARWSCCIKSRTVTSAGPS